MSKNSYRKALRHIKSKKIDERLELLSEIPTNATSGVYVDTPGQFVQDPDVDNPQFSDHPLDLTQDDSGTDTTGLFLADGTILSAIPPGDNSYVLGPMMSMYYSFNNFTQIGYVRQSDRKMTNLARITGTIDDWDGESNFTSYGQLTLEQAQWFRDQSKSEYYAFYPGAPASERDSEGRYEGLIVNSRRTYGTRTPDPRYVDSGSNRSGNASDNYSAQSDKDKSVDPKSYPTDPEERAQMSASELAELGINLLNIGLDIAAIAAIIFPEPGTSAVGLARIATRLGLRAGSRALKASRAARTTQALNQGVRAARVNPAQRVRNSAKNSKLKDWWNKGRNERVPDENNASWRDLMRDDLAQRGQSDASFAAGKPPRGIGRPDQAFNPFRPASKGGPGSGPTPAVRQAFERPVRSVRDNPKAGIAARSISRTVGESFAPKNNKNISDDIDNTIDIFIKLLYMTKLSNNQVNEIIQKFEEYAENSKELYPGQPSPNGFPDTPPPELAPNGYHPQFGKKADRYKRLDSISAKTMDRVKTGDPETDAQVSAAAKSVFNRFKKYR